MDKKGTARKPSRSPSTRSNGLSTEPSRKSPGPAIKTGPSKISIASSVNNNSAPRKSTNTGHKRRGRSKKGKTATSRNTEAEVTASASPNNVADDMVSLDTSGSGCGSDTSSQPTSLALEPSPNTQITRNTSFSFANELASKSEASPAPSPDNSASLETSAVPTKKEAFVRIFDTTETNAKESSPAPVQEKVEIGYPATRPIISPYPPAVKFKPVSMPTAAVKPLSMEERINITLTNARLSSRERPLSRGKSINNVHTGVISPFREHIIRAIRDHKIFSLNSNYPSHIRNALKQRGWVEKPHLGLLNVRTCIGSHLTRDVDIRGSEDEKDEAWASRVLEKYPSDFIWVVRRDNVDWRAMLKDQFINRFPRASFTTKVGITSCLQTMHWHTEPGLADTFFPRCYRLAIEEEKLGFIDDFRLTACISLLKWLCSTYERYGESGVSDKESNVTVLSIDFAIRQINNYVRTRRHEDVDWVMPPTFSASHWETFLKQYYEVIHKRNKVGLCDSSDIHGIYGKYDSAKKALSKLKPYWPQFDIDGLFNIWICKPGARSRGKGIIILNELDKVLDLLTSGYHREANWVVQKYIENPLLVYKTKFDMRQWFIVTDWAPLTIWFYKESYIRFCSKPFTLEDFHESVHLCNNAVQANYKNAEGRDSNLPEENMWDCYTFQSYLKTIGKLESWSRVIYPGMKESITGVMLASQEQVEPRKNCFELYGADFMLDSNLRPWLIEINSCPCMAGTTSVTARMCAQCLEDMVKVVVDKRENRNADTGLFEMIYRQNPATLSVQQFGVVDLFIQGKKLPKDVDWPGIMTKYNSKKIGASAAANVVPTVASKLAGIANMGSGLTFYDLVQKLKLNNQSDESPIPQVQVQKLVDSSQLPYIPTAIQHEAEPKSSAKSSNNNASTQPNNNANASTQPNNAASAKKNISNTNSPGIPTNQPVITFKGFPPRPATPELDYKEMIPNRQQVNEQTPKGIPWGTLHQNPLSDIKSRGLDMSILIRNPYPTAPTMADLLRMSQGKDEIIAKLHTESKNLRALAAAATVSPKLAFNKSQNNPGKLKDGSLLSGRQSRVPYAPPQIQNRNPDASFKQAVDAIRKVAPSKKERSRNPGL